MPGISKAVALASVRLRFGERIEARARKGRCYFVRGYADSLALDIAPSAPSWAEARRLALEYFAKRT